MLKRLLILILVACTLPAMSQQQAVFSQFSDSLLQKLVDSAKAHYPHVRIQETHIEMSKNALKKTKLSWFDAVSFSLVYSPKNTTTINAGVASTILSGYQAGISVNVGNILQKPYNIKLAKLDVRNAEDGAEEYMLSLIAAVKQRYYLYIQYLQGLRLTLVANDDVESLLQKIKYKFEKGEVSFDEYNLQLLAVNKVKQERVLAETNLLIAKSSLEELIGVKLESIK